MQKLIVANWKMHPAKRAEAKRIFTGIQKAVASSKPRGVQVVVCPPAIYLPEVAREQRGSKVQLGVQDVFYEETGAFTGQVSPAMVKQYKAKWAILGHSERRALGETNELVGRKVRHAIDEGLEAITCVGESERSEEGAYYTTIRDELEAVFLHLRRKDLEHLTIAYEPVWAIGKRADEAIQPPQLYEMVLFIKKLLIERFGRTPAANVAILYGGSVKPANAETFVKEGGVDGLLVGSASLDPQQCIDIITAAATA